MIFHDRDLTKKTAHKELLLQKNEKIFRPPAAESLNYSKKRIVLNGLPFFPILVDYPPENGIIKDGYKEI